MKYTLKQLREQNRAYAEQITPALLEHVNRLITTVEQTRTNKPQPLDNVDFTTEYGERTEHATIDGQNGKQCRHRLRARLYFRGAGG